LFISILIAVLLNIDVILPPGTETVTRGWLPPEVFGSLDR
jgi:hypothetical protein